MLGSGFKPRFISRFCIPLSGDQASDHVQVGFDAAPASRMVPRTRVLRDDSNTARPAPVPESPRYSTGFYRLKYLLEPRVAVHPRAFHESVPQDGPYELANMWSTGRFHHSIL